MLGDSIAFFARARAAQCACQDLRTGVSLTYAELDARCDLMAGALERLVGAERLPGARIAVLARNSADQAALHVACRRVGTVFVPLNWRLSERELATLVTLAEPALLLIGPEFAPMTAALRAAVPAAGCLSFEPGGEFDREVRAAPRRVFRRRGDDHDPVTLLFTSGTTGRPKGVIVTERNATVSAFNYALSVNLHAESRVLCDMPMFHVVGLLAVTCATLQLGGTLLISPAFAAAETYARLADPALGITHYFCVPQMLRMMREVPGFDAAPLRRLQAIQTGGAPHPASAIRLWSDEGVRVLDGYGMSEAGTVLGMPPELDVVRRKAGAVGIAAPFVDVRLVDAEGRDVSDDSVGEVWVGGASLTPGYWRDEAATRAAFQDGWFRTGDAARRDADGYYTIVDRWKDMYISGGENVYPVEVEAVLLEMPGVSEAAVIGVPDARWGEVGAAFLVMSAGAAPDDAAILAFCRARLAGYKVPRHLRRVATLPRTASGKLQKGPLRSGWRDAGG